MSTIPDHIRQKTFTSSGFLNLTPKGAYEACLQGALLLDVRDPALIAFKQFGVPEFISCHHIKLKEFADHLPDNRVLIVADSVGLFSHEAMIILKDLGFENIINLAGGLVEWERDGMPVVVDPNERLSGSCVCQLRPRERKG
ncbi:hypothetical protein DSECCO2_416030 [anaerobic digester metagenome]